MPNPIKNTTKSPSITQTTRWLPTVVHQHVTLAVSDLSIDRGIGLAIDRPREQRVRRIDPSRDIDTSCDIVVYGLDLGNCYFSDSLCTVMLI